MLYTDYIVALCSLSLYSDMSELIGVDEFISLILKEIVELKARVKQLELEVTESREEVKDERNNSQGEKHVINQNIKFY